MPQVNLVSDGLLNDYLLRLTQQLLDSIAKGSTLDPQTHRQPFSFVTGDWKTYEALTDPSLTCIEPETGGSIVIGLNFHRFFFEVEQASRAAGKPGPVEALTTISSPTMQLLGKDRDVAVLSYTRLIQRTDEQGRPVVIRAAETRVWEKKNGKWRHVHFHRSKL